MSGQLAMTTDALPEPSVDQVTRRYLERPGSATACVRELCEDAWNAAGSVHERRRLVALRDAVLGIVAEAERDADVAHGLDDERVA